MSTASQTPTALDPGSAVRVGRPGPAPVPLTAGERRRLFSRYLEDRRVPGSLTCDLGGRAAFSVRGADSGALLTSVWFSSPAGPPRRLAADSELALDLPCWSPDGGALAVAGVPTSSEVAGQVIVFDATGQEQRRSGPVDARIEALAWLGPDTLLVLGAEPGADSVVTSGAVRYTSPTKRQRPRVTVPGRGRRRLYECGPAKGVRTVGPAAGSVWDMAVAAGDRPVVVFSADPSESGWYDSVLAELDARTGELHEVYRPEWQLSPLATSPEHALVAVVEGWSSDRGRVCGDARVIDLNSGQVVRVAGPEVDIVTLAWRNRDSLWFAGWSGMTAVWGWFGLDGTVGLRRVAAVKPALMAFPRSAQGSIWAVSDPQDGAAPDVLVAEDTSGEPDFAPVTRLSRGQISAFAATRAEALSWSAADGLRIEGLLVLPEQPGRGPRPLVVYAHGGPANLWNTSLSPEVRFLVDAGFAVLLANPRGSVGRGQDFATANLGDPGGRELTDLIDGVTACARRDDVDVDRVAIIGGSYGGYLAACGAAMSDKFRCAVVMFGHPDLLSARYGSNNPAFYDKLLRGDPAGGNATAYVERSPIIHVSARSAPTLLVHGAEDRCCPIGQAEEMYRALSDHLVDTELVVYPDEGHGLHGIAARTDCWARTVDWLDRYLVRAA